MYSVIKCLCSVLHALCTVCKSQGTTRNSFLHSHNVSCNNSSVCYTEIWISLNELGTINLNSNVFLVQQNINVALKICVSQI
jgi:hypothetical protein